MKLKVALLLTTTLVSLTGISNTVKALEEERVEDAPRSPSSQQILNFDAAEAALRQVITIVTNEADAQPLGTVDTQPAGTAGLDVSELIDALDQHQARLAAVSQSAQQVLAQGLISETAAEAHLQALALTGTVQTGGMSESDSDAETTTVDTAAEDQPQAPALTATGGTAESGEDDSESDHEIADGEQEGLIFTDATQAAVDAEVDRGVQGTQPPAGTAVEDLAEDQPQALALTGTASDESMLRAQELSELESQIVEKVKEISALEVQWRSAPPARRAAFHVGLQKAQAELTQLQLRFSRR